MIMIRNIYYKNTIDLISLHRLSQFLIGTVIIIGCWHHIDSRLLALTILFCLLIYQTTILIINSTQQLKLTNNIFSSIIYMLDGVVCGIICVICISNHTLAVSICAFFINLFTDTGFKGFIWDCELIMYCFNL